MKVVEHSAHFIGENFNSLLLSTIMLLDWTKSMSIKFSEEKK